MTKAGFIILTIIMAALVYAGITTVASRTINDAKKLSSFRAKTLLLLTGWLVYVSALTFAGVFTTTALPPRVPLLLILPCFAFMVWFFRSGRFSDIISAMPIGWLVYAQSFRIVVELLLHAAFLEGLLPKAATFEGYNYEIAIGITALAVGYFGVTKNALSKTIILIWNYLGLTTLAIIVFIMISHAYFPHLYTTPARPLIETFGAFPNTLLAGFLMPLAVFMHVFCIVKLRREK